MNILQVIPYFCFGGAETMCENLTYALKEMGHEVNVVSLYAERTPISQRMEQAGVAIHYLDKKPGLDLSMIPKLTRLIRQLRPDVVHSHLNVIKYTAPAVKLAGVAHYVHTVHNVAWEEAENVVERITSRFFFRRGWAVPVALSPEVQTSITSFYGLSREQVPVIFNGIDLSRCLPKEDYETQNLTLIHIGRFNEQKNHKGLLEAFQLVLQTFPECRLKLLGDGELRTEMEERAARLGIAEKVDFLGSQPYVYPYLRDADVFLLPSLFEGMPMTIIEAMGTGLPVVASGVGGVPDMLTPGKSGILTGAQPEEVAQAVLTLAKDPALRRTMGQSARKESRRFSAQEMARQYCAIYEGRREQV